MAEQYANDVQTTLANAAGSGDTTITVSSTAGFPTSGNFRIRIDGELLLVTGVSGATWTVTRAVEAVGGVQTATSHSAGATVTHVLTAASVQLASSGASFPSGVMVAYGGSIAPSGWLVCDGSAVSRTTYAGLFTAIGTAYGAGDGSTTFNVPDLRDRVPIGVSPGSLGSDRPTARSLGQTGGEESHTLTTAEMPSHNHSVSDPGHQHGTADGSNFATDGSYTVETAGSDDRCPSSYVGSTNSSTTGITIGNTGGGGSHNNMQPFAVCNWIIKT